MMKKDFKNIQVQARPDLFDSFQDTFEQSGANSKGEFLGMLLECYLNPDHESVVKKLELNFEKERAAFEKEKQALIDQVNARSMFTPEITAMLQPVLDNNKGQTARFTNRKTGETEEIEVNTLEDILIVILKSVSIN